MRFPEGKLFRLVRFYYGPFLPAQVARLEAEILQLADEVPLEEQLIVQIGKPKELEDLSSIAGVAVCTLSEKKLFKAALQLSKQIKKTAPTHFFSHGMKAGIVAGLLKLLSWPACRILHIYEIHGAIAFESFSRHKQSLSKFPRFLVLYLQECFAIFLSSRVLLVSDALVSYYPLIKLKSHVAIPRLITPPEEDSFPKSSEVQAFTEFADQARQQGRRLVVYSGGDAGWQKIDETLELLNELEKSGRFSPVIFTHTIESLKTKVNQRIEDQSNWFVASLQRDELIGALSLCDFGVMLRENLVLNRVASPTKLFEYFYAGLAVMTTKAIPTAVQLIEETGAGVILGSISAQPDLALLDKANENRPKLGPLKKRFTWAYGKEQLIKLLKRESS